MYQCSPILSVRMSAFIPAMNRTTEPEAELCKAPRNLSKKAKLLQRQSMMVQSLERAKRHCTSSTPLILCLVQGNWRANPPINAQNMKLKNHHLCIFLNIPYFLPIGGINPTFQWTRVLKNTKSFITTNELPPYITATSYYWHFWFLMHFSKSNQENPNLHIPSYVNNYSMLCGHRFLSEAARFRHQGQVGLAWISDKTCPTPDSMVGFVNVHNYWPLSTPAGREQSSISKKRALLGHQNPVSALRTRLQQMAPKI